VRENDELVREDADSIYDMTAPPPPFQAPAVDTSSRARLSRLDPVDVSLYEDPTGDRADMPASSDEILQFSQDIMSKRMRDALQKKIHANDELGRDPLDELFMDGSDEHEDQKQALVQKESKNKQRKKRREARQHSQLLFTGVPKVPEKRFNHFYHVPPDRLSEVRQDSYVMECMTQLLPFLHLKAEDWAQKKLSLEDTVAIGRDTGLFYVKTHRRVEGKYIVHVYSDTKPCSDAQVQDYDVMLYLVCGKVRAHAFYRVLTFFFIKNESRMK